MKKDFYYDFEECFRGSRDEIISRLSSYDGLISYILQNCQKPKLLDIGSGRGEWIEKCSLNGIESIGLEINQDMISFCKKKGMNIISGDALNILKTLESNSFDIISSFHLIEHLKYDQIYEMITQCLRLLKTNGILIFETPSIDNLQVSSRTFFLDPTHINPINPDSFIFFLESLGFTQAKYYFLNGCENNTLTNYNGIQDLISGSAKDVSILATKNTLLFDQESEWLKSFQLGLTTMETAKLIDSNINKLVESLHEQKSLINNLQKKLETLENQQSRLFNSKLARLYRKLKSLYTKIKKLTKILFLNPFNAIYSLILRNRSLFFILRLIAKVLKFLKFNSFSSKIKKKYQQVNHINQKSSTFNSFLLKYYESSNYAHRIYEQIKSSRND
tara:strand:+ start:773 stop:1942 length:1170 start_codon:yes stop_codon:yes gene_type:complete